MCVSDTFEKGNPHRDGYKSEKWIQKFGIANHHPPLRVEQYTTAVVGIFLGLIWEVKEVFTAVLVALVDLVLCWYYPLDKTLISSNWTESNLSTVHTTIFPGAESDSRNFNKRDATKADVQKILS